MKSWKALGAALKNPQMAWMLVFGMSCGLPYILTKAPLSAWMTQEGVSLKTIGLFALVGAPYTVKFLWAPLVDRYTPPFLGRRRGWALIFQVLLALVLLAISVLSPTEELWWIALLSVLISFLGASQDIVVDAYRAEAWSKEELGLANSVHVTGYLISFRWIGNAVALFFADYIGWPNVFRVMAGTQLLGAIASWFAREPENVISSPPQSLLQSVYVPLADYLKRKGALEIMLFIMLYKIGENIASVMTTPFFLKIGFEQKVIGAVAKPVGFVGILLGGLVGGVFMLRLGVYRSLWIFGAFQGMATILFALLVYTGPSIPALAAVIAVDNLAIGMGTAAFTTFMMNTCNKNFTATQYALLTSLMAVPVNVFSASSGFLAESLGWVGFFIFCTVIAFPGLLLLVRYPKWQQP